MKTMTIYDRGWVARWAGGSFVAAWHVERAEEHVPDEMISFPENLVVSRVTEQDIRRIVRDSVAERTPISS